MAAQHNPNTKDNARTPYVAPAVVRVTLRPEEAVLGHCKTASSGGPIGGCALHSCHTPGS